MANSSRGEIASRSAFLNSDRVEAPSPCVENVSIGPPSQVALYTTVRPSGAKRARQIVPLRKEIWRKLGGAMGAVRNAARAAAIKAAATTISPIRTRQFRRKVPAEPAMDCGDRAGR